jgi:hypothetical protein
MKYALFRYGLCLLALILCLSSAKGQKDANRVSFYYTAGKHVFKGSVTIDLSLHRNGNKLPSSQVVDCREYSLQNFEIRATVSNLSWGLNDHKDRYKLAFSDEYVVPGDGLRQKGSGGMYLGQNKKPETISFELTSFQELSTSGIFLAFFVLDHKATFEDIESSTSADGKVLGFGCYIHPLTLVPPNYNESEEGEIEMYNLFNVIFVNGMNSSMEELSYELAEYVKQGDYKGFERKIEEKGPSSSREVSGGKKTTPIPKQAERADADDRAFKKASIANTAAAYQGYLNEYPRGRYAETAKSQVLELTPFDLQVEEYLEGAFKFYTISFLQGVGTKRPILTLTNNLDWAVKEEWTDHRKVTLKLPPERTVTATFSLGRKSERLELSHGAYNFHDTDPEPPVPHEKDTKGNPIAFSLLLALPFLGAIGYLLHKKYR